MWTRCLETDWRRPVAPLCTRRVRGPEPSAHQSQKVANDAAEAPRGALGRGRSGIGDENRLSWADDVEADAGRRDDESKRATASRFLSGLARSGHGPVRAGR